MMPLRGKRATAEPQAVIRHLKGEDMEARRRLLIALLVAIFYPAGAFAQRPTGTNLRGNRCAHEGLIATGLFTTRFSAAQSTYERTDTLPTGFRLLCEKQQLIFEHQEWAGTSTTNSDEHWYEYWGVIDTVRETHAYSTLQFTFSKLGGGNMVGVLTFNDYQTASPSVLFAVEKGYLTRKFFGRLTYVAPEYLQDIPMPTKQ